MMPQGWEDNRRSGVALAIRHGLSSLSTYWLNDHRKGDEGDAPEEHSTLYLYLLSPNASTKFHPNQYS